jgi:hypothetical protein
MMPNGAGQVMQRKIVTQEERDQMLQVQAMQVRTNAANLASQMLQHRQTSLANWTKWAEHIAKYIWEGVSADGPAAPVRPGG